MKTVAFLLKLRNETKQPLQASGMLFRSSFSTDCPKSTEGCADAVNIIAVNLRINSAIPSLSRRAADHAISQGRITVNGKRAIAGMKVRSTDIIRLDGIRQTPCFPAIESSSDFRDSTQFSLSDSNPTAALVSNHIYIKMWKIPGIICTTDLSIPHNIISFGNFKARGISNRIFPVGRLDKDTSGLILLTSDGHFMHSVLGKKSGSVKKYEVRTERDLNDEDIKQLSKGVPITTTTTSGKVIVGNTLPCNIMMSTSRNRFAIELIEGRNNQIKRMVNAVNNQVVSLHRLSFSGINLGSLKPGHWSPLSNEEMKQLEPFLRTRKI